MARRPILFALLVLALAAARGVAVSAGERLHRLHVPPPPVQVLPQSIAVDEDEWHVRGTHLEVAAGRLQIHVYNRGMDDHDLAVVDAHGVLHTVPLASGADAELDVDVAAGPLKLYCSLFEGTPDSHELKGMVFNLTAR
jgi:hypothetical protein